MRSGFARPAGGRGRGGGQVADETLRAAPTTWRFDPARSAIYLPRTKGFPKNTEVEATITYEAQTGGARTTPDPKFSPAGCTIAFVEPPTGYAPREADPRIGVGTIRFSDYSQPNSRDNGVEWVTPASVGKKNPGAAMSEPVQPIVYYLDPAIPEPTRSAMKDGFLWWNKSFEAAGYRNALEIRDAPADMDPMDIRYNQIYWVDRDERGYSTGGGLTDPRTGEILAARVRLESDRVRTASRYWQSYRPGATSQNGSGDNDEGMFLALPPYSTPETEQQLVLLREALLTAHEAGHSLGFGHNWTSSMNERASVMEYPSPRVGPEERQDRSDRCVSERDRRVRHHDGALRLHRFRGGQREGGAGRRSSRDMRKQGLLFTPATDPRWNRYDDLGDPAEYLRQMIAQRKVLLAGLWTRVLKAGEPLRQSARHPFLDDVPAPPLGHRYRRALYRRHVP